MPKNSADSWKARMPKTLTDTATTWALPLLAVAALLFLLVSSSQAEGPRAVVRDLQQGASLVGQWRFKPGDDPTWADPGFDDSAWSARAVPARWPAGGYPETNQMAWYRLTLQLDIDNPRQLQQLALRMGKVLSAYELYAGGQLLGGARTLADPTCPGRGRSGRQATCGPLLEPVGNGSILKGRWPDAPMGLGPASRGAMGDPGSGPDRVARTLTEASGSGCQPSDLTPVPRSPQSNRQAPARRWGWPTDRRTPAPAVPALAGSPG